MARMSIDDSFGREPRVKRLARLCGWSRREMMGTLLDIYATCYDRVNEFLPEADILTTVQEDGLECPGFIEKMIEVGLARRFRGGMIRISGAEDRIRYLRKQSALGRTGGLKSGERRKKPPKGQLSVRFDGPQGSANPPDPSPDPSPDPVPDPSPVPSLSPDPPTLRVVTAVDEREEHLRRLLRRFGTEHAIAFAEVKQQLGSTALGPSVVDDHVELREFLWGTPSLVDLDKRCEHVIAVRKAEATAKGTLQYFGGSMWKRQNVSYALAREIGEADGAKLIGEKRQSAFAVAGAFFDELEHKEKA